MTGTRRPAEDIVTAELSRLLRQELTQGLRGVFEGLLGGGGNGLQVVINNNAGVAVTAREGTGAMNQKQLEITIDQMVAQSLMQGRQTTGILRSLFGIVPGLR